MHILPIVLLALELAAPDQGRAPAVTPPAAKTPEPQVTKGKEPERVREAPPPAAEGAEVPRLNIVIDPKTPVDDLLPQAPHHKGKTVNLFEVDLAKVPEVAFQEPRPRQLSKGKATYEIAHQLAKMRHLNGKNTDKFLETLIAKRPDLQGLPFVMGKACRTTGDRAKLFGMAALGVHQTLGKTAEGKAKFWETFEKDLEEARKHLPKLKALLDGKIDAKALVDGKIDENGTKDCKGLNEVLDVACVAALMQILAPESAEIRKGLVTFLAKMSHVEATQALAKLALFSAEEEVRRPALEALKGRRAKDYQAILMQGFHYPLPEVAKRAGEAVAYLKHKDLVPKLVDLLDTPDPRLPVVQEVNGKKVRFVREVVRVNHHRNCMLCHTPATVPPGLRTAENRDPAAMVKQLLELLTAAPVPLPGEPLPPPSQGYDPSRGGSLDILVAIDTTYLRQDFSLMLPVSNAAPWPERQRFDYFVRRRVLTEKEAEEYRQQAPTPEPDVGNPYQQTVVSALRELTGRQAGPNARTWRFLLAER
jgi:hypothetical protein